MATRKTRKHQIEADTQPDPFLDTANRAAAWVEKHLKQITVGALAIGLVVAVVLVVQRTQSRKVGETTAELRAAVEAYDAATGPRQTATATTPTAKAALIQKAKPEVDKVVETHPDSGAAYLARLYAADLAMRDKDSEKALGLYEAYLSQSKPDDPLHFLALEGAGYAAEALGQKDKALGYFERLTNLPDNFYKDYGLKHVGRMHETQGDKDKALAAYKRLVEELPDSRLRAFADERIAALQ